jgi:3-oxoacyl-[acyl-carrier protein] reductase
MSQTQAPLAGKVAVVTGAGRGIGRAIALAYASAGAAVCCAARTAAEIDATAAEIVAGGGRALAIPTDVTDHSAVLALMAQAAQAFGGIDLLVCNAGGADEWQPVAESTPAAWEATIALNLLGTYYCMNAAIPYLRQRGAGKIITIGSGLGHNGRAGGSAYACAKAGAWMLTRVAAQELWRDAISVNELIPGPVDTSPPSDAPDDTATLLGESECLKTPEDVVPLALFLATQPTIGPTAQSFSLMRRDG